MQNPFRRLGRKLMWVVGKVLPINSHKILIFNYSGRGFGDNAKGVVEELLRRNSKARIIWAVKNEKERASLPPEIEACLFDSVACVYHQVTAKIWIDNCRRFFVYKKKNQYYLQLWHGFPIKRIEGDVADKLEDTYVKNAIKDSRHTDLLLSNSTFCTEVLRRTYWYDGEIAEYGSPRNDVFFRDNTAIRKKVLNAFGLPEDRKLVLYAPTFRADHSTDAYQLDAEQVQKACAKRFGGDWTVLIRLHPNVATLSGDLFHYDGENIADGTMYPDMQDLQCAADILITDYSSTIVDFSLSQKPGLRFALDMEEYRKDRGTYFTPEELPYPLTESNEALQKAILEFDEEHYRATLQAFFEKNGFKEDGNASARCADWIEAHLN